MGNHEMKNMHTSKFLYHHEKKKGDSYSEDENSQITHDKGSHRLKNETVKWYSESKKTSNKKINSDRNLERCKVNLSLKGINQTPLPECKLKEKPLRKKMVSSNGSHFKEEIYKSLSIDNANYGIVERSSCQKKFPITSENPEADSNYGIVERSACQKKF